MVKGLYVHKKEGRWRSSYTIVNLEYESEGPLTIVQHDKYVLLQVIPEEKIIRLYMFKNNELCMRGWNFKKLTKKEMEEELQWCIEKYEEDLRKQNNEQ